MQTGKIFNEAVTAHRAGRFDQAERLYRRCLKQRPDHPEILIAFAVLSYQTGRIDDSARLLQTVLDKDPGNVGALLNLGNCRQAQDRYHDAESCFRRVLTLAPDFVEAWVNLGNAVALQGRTAEAIGHYRQALALRPAYEKAAKRLALCLLDEGVMAHDAPLLQEASARLAPFMTAGDRDCAQALHRAHFYLALYGHDPHACRAAFARCETSAMPGEMIAALRLEMARLELDCGHDRSALQAITQAVPPPAGWSLQVDALAPGGWDPDRPLPVETLTDATLLCGGRDWLVLDQGGVLHVDGLSNANPEAGHYVRLLVGSGKAVVAHPPVTQTLTAPHILLGGAANYYHWMLDYLPRLGLIADRDDPLIVNDDLASFQHETLRILNIDTDRLVPVDKEQAIRCNALIVPAIGCRFQHPHPQTLNWLRRMFEPQPVQNGPKRLWLSRQDASTRRIVNEVELDAVLQKFGFAKIAPGALTVREQIALFAQAQMVAGPHGAAFTNLVFSPGGARVLEIMPGQHRQLGFYPPLSQACGHTHRRMQAHRLGSDSQNADMRIDPKELEAQLAALEKSRP